MQLLSLISPLTKRGTSTIIRSITSKPKTVSILSLPLNIGQPFEGVDLAPQMLEEAGLHTKLQKLGWKTNVIPTLRELLEVSEIDNSTRDLMLKEGSLYNAKNVRQVGYICKLIEDAVYKEAMKKGNFVLMIGMIID